MAIYEQDKVFYSEESNGDKTIFLPITRANNVEGLGRSANTTYSVGDVVYADTNKAIALKCTTAGTTSDSELDIGTNVVGDSITDGGVVWSVVKRDLSAEVSAINNTLPTKANLGALSMPSSNSISLSTSLTSYIAPADGWMRVFWASRAGDGYLNTGAGKYVTIIPPINYTGSWNCVTMPIAKGETWVFNKMGDTLVVELAFIYAQSEV